MCVCEMGGVSDKDPCYLKMIPPFSPSVLFSPTPLFSASVSQSSNHGLLPLSFCNSTLNSSISNPFLSFPFLSFSFHFFSFLSFPFLSFPTVSCCTVNETVHLWPCTFQQACLSQGFLLTNYENDCNRSL